MLDKNSPFTIAPASPKRSDSRLALAVSLIGDAILDCDLAPAALVAEVDLDRRFALGLASVRGALARLEAQGLVAAEERRGWRILPISAEHLADLEVSRRCLEPVLGIDAPPRPLAQELAGHARLAAVTLDGLGPRARLHQERLYLRAAAKTLASPRLRGWLSGTWDLSLRADSHLSSVFGIHRPALPIPALLDALCAADAAQVADVLGVMLTEFSDRCRRALARSAAPLAAPEAAARATVASGPPRLIQPPGVAPEARGRK